MKAFSRIALVIVVFISLSNAASAQGISNYWLLGYNGSIVGGGGGMSMNFDSIPLTMHRTPRKMNFDGANASICDKQGKLLFYTNGICIMNSQNDTMLNGKNLSPGSFSNYFKDGSPLPQSVLIIPDPGDTNEFYLFHQFIDWLPSPFSSYVTMSLLYSKVNKTLDNNKGAVTQKNIGLLSDTLIACELTACKHANGRDWWLITHKLRSTIFYKLLITPAGILGPYTQQIGDTLKFGLGQVAFSPDGKHYGRYQLTDDISMFDFDRCSGDFSNYRHVGINDSSQANGFAFSPNSSKAYASSGRYVYQINLEDSSSNMGLNTVAVYDGFMSPHPPLATTFFLAHLAPNGKIYINSTNSVDFLHEINNPDSLGLTCNLSQHSFPMPTLNFRTIPNYPNYFLGADSGSVCDTLQLAIKESTSTNNNYQISAFPNPTRQLLHINYTPTEKTKILELYNADGKMMLSQFLPPWSQVQHINVSTFSPGLYVCKMSLGQKYTLVKFMKLAEE